MHLKSMHEASSRRAAVPLRASSLSISLVLLLLLLLLSSNFLAFYPLAFLLFLTPLHLPSFTVNNWCLVHVSCFLCISYFIMYYVVIHFSYFLRSFPRSSFSCSFASLTGTYVYLTEYVAIHLLDEMLSCRLCIVMILTY